MVNVKQKGAGFERDVANFLEDLLGIKFSRNPFEQQRQANQPDLIADDPDFPFSIECKRYKGGEFMKAWWTQSDNAARAANKLPCVIYKFDRKPVMVAVDWKAIGFMTGTGLNDDGLIFMNLESFAFCAREIMAGMAENG